MKTTVEEARREQIYKLIDKVLPEDSLKISVDNISVKEVFAEDATQIICTFRENDTEIQEISAQGCGVLDALFESLLKHYSGEYTSLDNISFRGFDARPDFGETNTSGADAEIEVSICFRNFSKTPMTFRNKGKSFLRASVQGVFNAIEFYINCEKCFKRLKFLIDEANSRGRADLAQGYISDISAIVKVTSYENI